MNVEKLLKENFDLKNKINELQNQFETIFEQSSEGIFIANNKGNYIDVNKEGCRMIGYTKEEILGKNLKDLLTKEELETTPIKYEQLESSNMLSSKRKLLHKSGRVISVEINGKKLENGNLIGIVKNITEYDELSKKLKDSEEKFSKIFKLTPNPISIISIENGKVLEVNDEALKMSGYSREQLLNTPNLQNNLWAEPSEKERLVLKLAKEGYLKNEEVLVKSQDNNLYNCLLSSEFIELDNKMYVLNLLNDFTKQKQIQQKLNNERKNLKTLIETLPDLVWVKDLEGVYLSCNNKFEQFIGHKESKIIGKTDYELVEKDLADFFRENDKKALENNKPTINLEWLTFANDSHKELVQTIKTPLYDNSNKLIGVLGLGHDITELYKTQEEIKRLNMDLEEKVKERTKLLEQANKDLESFAYSVSHDLRAPLRHIDGFTNLLKVKLPVHNEESDKYIGKITNSSKQMSLMIDELLKFSRLGRKTLEKSIVYLNVLIDQIIEQYKPDYSNRKITFEVEELPEILGDSILLRSVFENLISNAIKFTSKKEEAIIKIGLIEEGNKQIIYIKDNGAGFDMIYSNKLFGVFQRLHVQNEFSGTGVGLANVKQIINKHDWDIHAKSEINKGTTFFITLNN